MFQQCFHVSFYYHITVPENYFACDFIVMAQSKGALVVRLPVSRFVAGVEDEKSVRQWLWHNGRLELAYAGVAVNSR